MFSNSASSFCWSILAVPLKVMCSRKCAVPEVAAVSLRLPELIKTPTVAVSPWPLCRAGRGA